MDWFYIKYIKIGRGAIQGIDGKKKEGKVTGNCELPPRLFPPRLNGGIISTSEPRRNTIGTKK
jgi:hypothetical protein